MLAPSASSASKFPLSLAKRKTFAGLISFRYLLLRVGTAGAGLIAGLAQTFVFAHVLQPDQFSVFILIATVGMSLWVFDLGVSKILFVQLRAKYLAGEDTSALALQANAIALLYVLLIAAGAVLCFAVGRGMRSASPGVAIEFALFFLFSALNLVWFVLRNLSIAVDEYIFFETLEAVRRFGYIAILLSMLVGVPFPVFLIVVNLLWVALFAVATVRLLNRGALTPRLRGSVSHLKEFFLHNYHAALRTGVHAVSELYIHNILYIVVPVVLGLGAPTIVLDTTIKIFYGTLVLCTAACDLLVPRQTAAFAERDASTLMRATFLAIGLCALPAVTICAALWYDSQHLFSLLLGSAATIPAAVTPILTVLLGAAVVRTACNYLLQYTGFFREMSHLSIVISLTMTAAAGAGVLLHLDIVGLLELYAAVYAISALLYLFFAVTGPFRTVRIGHLHAVYRT